MALARNPPEKMPVEWMEEKRACGDEIQVALGTRPFVDNVYTLAAALKMNAIGLN
jgi:hypothetical protein